MKKIDWVARFKSTTYWTAKIQTELYTVVKNYLQKNDLTQTDFGKKIDASKSYVSQVLSGNFNHTLPKLVQISTAADKAPMIVWVDLKSYANQAAQGVEDIDILQSHVNLAVERKKAKVKRYIVVETTGSGFSDETRRLERVPYIKPSDLRETSLGTFSGNDKPVPSYGKVALG